MGIVYYKFSYSSFRLHLTIIAGFFLQECGLEVLGRRIRLQGHEASITCVEISEAFSIVVTGSEDGTAIIWDLNR